MSTSCEEFDPHVGQVLKQKLNNKMNDMLIDNIEPLRAERYKSYHIGKMYIIFYLLYLIMMWQIRSTSYSMHYNVVSKEEERSFPDSGNESREYAQKLFFQL